MAASNLALSYLFKEGNDVAFCGICVDVGYVFGIFFELEVLFSQMFLLFLK